MADSCRHLKNKMTLSAQKAAKGKTLKLLQEMPSQELRRVEHFINLVLFSG